jgi:hypothetical protein
MVLLHVSRKQIRTIGCVLSCILNFSTGVEVGGYFYAPVALTPERDFLVSSG